MRRYICLALFLSPAWSFADGIQERLQIDLTRLVAAASGHDWNDDGLDDRLIMVINDAGDAVDLITFFSESDTGRLGPGDIMRSVLPANWPQEQYDLIAINYQDSGPDGAGHARPVLYGGAGPLQMTITLRHDQGSWAVDVIRSNGTPDSGVPGCYLDYTTGVGRMERSGRTDVAVDVTVPPVLGAYWWRDGLPAVCRKADG
ncbi:hypothetical protein [Roseobacter sp. CCS2]|uniref:hypothetical protein n=1 Tax=Roseobacter sp. CCS2 TaxID=391593 RepID=UPI0000F40565|nr:hypothetical protein [Roseobacter sp. CCS2]EBA11437.1 hypothetical protein RCCS2_02223 [Roseobacter sp. CCS2]